MGPEMMQFRSEDAHHIQSGISRFQTTISSADPADRKCRLAWPPVASSALLNCPDWSDLCCYDNAHFCAPALC